MLNLQMVLRFIMNARLLPPSGQDPQVIEVLTAAAQRVAQEAQCQVVTATMPDQLNTELQALAKQQHVLTVTAQMLDQDVAVPETGHGVFNNAALVAAAQQVVFHATRHVMADRSVGAQASPGVSSPTSATRVTVNEISAATQTAVAQAVQLTGPLSSEVDVLVTASCLLQHQTGSSSALGASTTAP